MTKTKKMCNILIKIIIINNEAHVNTEQHTERENLSITAKLVRKQRNGKNEEREFLIDRLICEKNKNKIWFGKCKHLLR